MKTWKTILLISAAWLTACTGEEPARDGSSYAIEVEGDARASLASPRDFGRFTHEKPQGMSPRYVLWFGSRENDLVVTVIFHQAEPPASGSYALATSLARDRPVTGMVLDKRRQPRTFVTGAEAGTLEITRSANNTYSGRMKFRALESGPGTGKVTVEGKFRDVPMRGMSF